MARTASPQRLGFRPWRVGLSAAQLLLPATLALVGLLAFGQLRIVPALVAWLFALIASALLASLRERRLLATRQYLYDLVEAREPSAPPGYGPLIDDGLDTALRHIGRALAERRERAAEADRLLSALLDALPDPLLVVGRERMVVRANQAATAFIGHSPVDRPLETCLRDPGLLAATDGALQGPPADGGPGARITLHLPGEPPRAFAVRIVPVRLRGQPAVLVSLRELTEQLMIERMRSDFVANASHEIRTPLAALLGFIETLQGSARDDPEAQKRFLETMAAEARRMSRLVHDLLSLSRIESMAHLPPEGETDLVECIEAVAQTLTPYAEQRRVRLQVEAPASLPHVPGDRDQIVQLLTNLIDNAIKYGGEETTVTVLLERLEAAPPSAGPLTGRPSVRVIVRDQGPGIAREHLPRLTERFFRVDPARSRALGGTGLGLAIVKHILRRHRGHLAFASELGRGTEVTVYLPCR